MEFRLLGAFEIVADGASVDLGPSKQRTLLAALAVDAGRPLSPAAIVDLLWDGEPPRDAPNALRTYVSRIRKVLRATDGSGGTIATVERDAAGYRLVVDADSVDLHRFAALAEHARTLEPGDPQRSAALGEAVSLWQGEALAGMPGAWAERVRQRLRQQRFNVTADWARAELEGGRHAAVVEVLADLVTANPLVEPLAALLIRALVAAGRGAEALAAFTRVRQQMADEVGIEPGPELQALHAVMLRAPAPGHGSVPAPQPGPLAVRPAQLPSDVYGFTGREAQLAALDALLDEAADQPTGVVISAICGTAGVGKTALAVHWAHRVAVRFPDGQLYVNLRGFDAGSAVEPIQALQGFVEALGVPASRMPTDLAALSALFRSMLAGKQMLVVLDNARDASQIRPLLPGGPGSMVLITGRHQMPSLVAAEGAHLVLLDLPPIDDARRLMARRIGAQRVEAEPRAADEIIERCARLPLALAIVAARAAVSPHMSLEVLAGNLRDIGSRLSAMSTEEAPIDVRAAFSWSYRRLTPGAARLFRVLGLHPGPHVTTAAAARLADLSPATVDDLLRELVGAQLLGTDADGRYAFHDLLRAYASEQAHALDSVQLRQAALTRLLDWYLAEVITATDLVAPNQPPPGVEHRSAAPADQSATDTAVRWLDAERPNLTAACAHAAKQGWPDHAVRIAAAMWRYLNRGGHYAEAIVIHTYALEAAQLTADAETEANALSYLGTAHSRQGRYREGAELLLRAFEAFHAIGDRTGEARALTNLGVVYGRQGRYRDAAEVFGQALSRFRDLDHRQGQALVLTNLGMVHDRLGSFEQAAEQHAGSLALARAVGDRVCEYHALNGLGLVYAKQGRYTEASEHLRASLVYCRAIGDRVGVADALANIGLVEMWRDRLPDAIGNLRQSLDLFREAGDRYGEARALNGLGEAMRAAGRNTTARGHHEAALAVAVTTDDQHQIARAHAGLGDASAAAGDTASALDHWQQALDLYVRLQVPEADTVRARLAG